MRLVIADDHELVRQGLRGVLAARPEWVICGEAGDGRQAVEQCREHKPHVAILDISMPELNGLEAARQIRKLSPATEVLILTMHDAEDLVNDLLSAGARGFILKTDTSRLLVTAIESLAAHKPFFTGKVSALVLDRFLHPREAEPAPAAGGRRVTAREREIIQLLAEGRTSKEAAVHLGLSVKTIDAHRANIMHKLDIHSVTELVRYAVRNRIIEP